VTTQVKQGSASPAILFGEQILPLRVARIFVAAMRLLAKLSFGPGAPFRLSRNRALHVARFRCNDEWGYRPSAVFEAVGRIVRIADIRVLMTSCPTCP